MKKDGFFRCYLEALALWIGGNVLMALGKSASAAMGWTTSTTGYSLSERLAQLFDPFFLIASGVLIVPLFAAILVGSRRGTRANDA